MPQIINTNIGSLNAQRHLNSTQTALSTSLERLASGKRINSAKDDAAGLGISSRMSSQVNGMNQAIRNARDGISMAQTAEGALKTSEGMLQRIRTLAVQSSNASNSPADRQAIQEEVNNLVAELDRFAQTTTFNGQYLLDGTMGTAKYQVGANAGELISFAGSNFRTNMYGSYNKEMASGGITGETLAARSDFLNMSASNGITGGDLVITGYAGTATVEVADDNSAQHVADLINGKAELTGVSAQATTTVYLRAAGLSDDATAESYTLDLISNNTKNDGTDYEDPVTIGFTIAAGSGTDAEAYTIGVYANAVSEINKVSGKTGITAEWDDATKAIKLVNITGADIRIFNAAASDNDISTAPLEAPTPNSTPTFADSAAGAGVNYAGTVELYSSYSFAVVDADSNLGLGGAGVLQTISTLDVTTFESAQKAIRIAAAGIDNVNREMANYGALQNRLQYTIENLEISSENTTNARSRIEDADFAQETANLSRATILQQAGIAMLAQANQMPQQVLSLIR